MKLERHIAVAIGDGLEASSIALRGRGNARLVWSFARVAMTLVILGCAPPVHAGRHLGLRLCPWIRQQYTEQTDCGNTRCWAAQAPLALPCCCVQ